ncbi:aldose 1-epimerase family protein [Chthonomonas calidirosea]|nr:aldose 1-epimerase family protein [Chthonomonas calidirosea]
MAKNFCRETLMVALYGQSFTKEQLLTYVGDLSQIARVLPYRLQEGKEDGVYALDVFNGSGLRYTVLASRGMDISSASFNGCALAWRSATTDAHPAYFDHEGEGGRGWLRSFYGGLVVTCGLTYAGANGEDEGRLYGLHGRISNLPAYNVSYETRWEGDEYALTVRGKVREATVFGENLELTRTITTYLGSPSLHIHDEVANLGYRTTEHMILYHINIGFPIIADGARLIAPTLNATPRDADAEEDAERYAEFDAPKAGYREKVYFHQFPPQTDQVAVSLVNPNLQVGGVKGLGFRCRYRPSQLPRFSEWKMLDAGTYVVGLEPANCLVLGRAHERKAGTLQFLEPGEVRQYDITLDVLWGMEAIHDAEQECQHMLEAAGQPA